MLQGSVLGKMKKKYILLLFTMLGLSLMSGCNKENNSKDENNSKETSKQARQFNKTDFVMDTVLNVTTYGKEDVSSIIKENLQKLEYEELSWRESSSMATIINEGCQKGEKVTMDESFAQWTKASVDLAEKSGGAFDPTIGNLTRLWNIEGEHPVVPKEEEIKACLSKIGYQNINIEGTDISMVEGSTLDLGAIGKGIGCDEVYRYLCKRPDVDGAIVAIGGSILVYGSKPDQESWNVAIQDPNKEDGNYMGVISVKGTHYISTSGDYEKYFEENGKRYHHILDPHTGYPSESGLRSVTILCDNGLLSDGLSTACFVLGEEKGLALCKEYGAECIMIDKNNKVILSDGMEDLFSILEDSYKIKEQ